MPIGGRFDPIRAFWGGHAVPVGAGAPQSKGALLRLLEGLILEGQAHLKAFAEGRTVFVGYLENTRGRMQHCLLDVGETAEPELRELAAMDLKISDDLAQWYAKRVYNDFDVKDNGDPADFRRAQAEYDRTMPAKITRMVELLQQVHGKMLNPALPASVTQQHPVVSPVGSKAAAGPHKPYSSRDNALYESIGAEDLAQFTDAELWKRRAKYLSKIEPKGRKATPSAFRARLFRIRKHHGVPAPKF